jgi:hypothetical protein
MEKRKRSHHRPTSLHQLAARLARFFTPEENAAWFERDCEEFGLDPNDPQTLDELMKPLNWCWSPQSGAHESPAPNSII